MDEIVKVIRIESDSAEQTVAGLVSEIKNLTEAMNGVEKGTEQYTNILKELIDNQDKLGKAMRANKQEVTAAEGSYNALVKQMAALKKQWRETTDEASRKELGNQIKDINGKLKNMDASIGNFQRNVGNYADGVKGAFGQMGGAAKGMVGPLNSVKQGFNALAAHPLVAVLTALAALLMNGIAKGFKSSEENMNKLRTAFAGFQAIGDAVTKMFQKLAGWIADVAEKAINLADKLGLLGPKFKERQEMTKKQIELEKKERDVIVQKAQLETDAAELRAKASDEENYTIQQRIQFLQEAQAKEEEQLGLEKEILEQKIAQLEAQMALTDSTGEELTKLNELKAQVIQVNAKIADSQRNTNKQISSLRKRGLSEAQQANQARLNLEKDLLKQELDLAANGSKEQLELAKELRAKELEIQLEGLKQKIKNRKDYEKAEKLAIQAYNKDLGQLEIEHIQKQREERKKQDEIDLFFVGTSASARLKERKKQLEKELKEMFDESDKLLPEFDKKIAEGLSWDEAKKAIKSSYGSLQDLLLEQTKKQEEIWATEGSYFDALENEAQMHVQRITSGIRPMSEFYLKEAQLLEQYYNDFYVSGEKLHKRELESEDEWEARRTAALKEVQDAYANYEQAMRDEITASVYFNYKLFESAGEDVIGQLKADEELAITFTERTTNQIRMFLDKNLADILSNMERTKVATSDTVRALMDLYIEYSNAVQKASKDAAYASSKEFEDLKKRYDEMVQYLYEKGQLPQILGDAYIESLSSKKQKTKALWNEYVEQAKEAANAIGKLIGGIGDIYEGKVERHKKALEADGKLDEKERKMLEDEYNNTVKPMRIAEAVISTITGSIDAFTSAQKLGPPMGPIVGAINAAAVIAMGIANIAKIRSTNPYEDNSSSLSSGNMTATVTPTVSDFQPEYSTNLTGRSDTEYLNEALGNQKLFVSVVDINDAQERGRVRVAESSF